MNFTRREMLGAIALAPAALLVKPESPKPVVNPQLAMVLDNQSRWLEQHKLQREQQMLTGARHWNPHEIDFHNIALPLWREVFKLLPDLNAVVGTRYCYGPIRSKYFAWNDNIQEMKDKLRLLSISVAADLMHLSRKDRIEVYCLQCYSFDSLGSLGLSYNIVERGSEA